MGLLARLNKKSKYAQAPEQSNSAGSVASSITGAREEDYQSVKTQIHSAIVEHMPEDLRRILNNSKANQDEVRRMVEELCAEAVLENPFAVPLGDRERLVDELISEILGLGPIEPLLKDSSISEVMVNGPYAIYIERAGRIFKTDVRFRDEEHLMHVIDRIVTAVGRRVDETSPLVDARLADGSRVNVIIPPLALNGPTVTIRKFSKDVLTTEKLIEYGSLSKNMALFLEACVKGRLNMVVSGGTGSGKTTLLNVLSGYVPEFERIITIEDSAELQLRQEHLITLETRPPNIEGEGQITTRDLVRNALRMRPDRIIVGEVRSGEALDMLQAMNTGHDGSMTTAHANSTRDLLSRLETMVLMSGMELPLRAIRQQISSAVDIVVQIARLRDGSRKITSICEVTGMEGDIITMQDIFSFEPKGINEDNRVVGDFLPSGIRPYCLEKIKINGGVVDNSIFFPER